MTAKQLIKKVMIPNNISCIVWTWEDCPIEEKWELGHGGDEDYVILHKDLDWRIGEAVVQKLTVCDSKEKEIQEGYVLSVTAHA